jgi:hypothetical protein
MILKMIIFRKRGTRKKIRMGKPIAEDRSPDSTHCFINEILSATNKSEENGYTFTVDYPWKNRVLSECDEKKLVMIRITKGKDIILIIECKAYQEIYAYADLYNILTKFLHVAMTNPNCEIGIFMSAYNAHIFHRAEDGVLELDEEINLTTQEGIDRIIDVINEI